MKKIIILLMILFFCGGMYAAQLSYRFANPRIIRLSAVDHLQFDVQIQCDVAGTYLWGSTVKFNFNNTTFNNTANNWVVTKIGEFNGINTNSAFKYNITKTITGTAPNKVYNILVAGDNGVMGNGPSADDFVEVPTTWTTIITVSARLLVTSGDALAGLDFFEAGMNGATTQQYITGPSTVAYYTNPNIFDSRNFTNAYAGRFYSTTHGWSQIGGGTNNVQYSNWATNVSTTVWEDASITQTDATAALVNNLFIGNGSTTNPVLTIPASKWLTVSGTMTSPDAASLVIESDGSLIHSADNVLATFKRTITGSSNPALMKYHFVSVPLTAAAGATTGIFTGSYLFDFVEANNTWHSMGASADTPLDVSKGYMTYFIGGASTTNIFSGAMNNGAFTATTSFTDANPHGYNLVPNPYPSAIDWLTGSWTKSNIDNATYIWSPGADAPSSNYASFVGGIGNNGGTQFIPAGQAFFVHANAAAPALSMDNSVRIHNTQAFWKEGEVIPNVLRITSSANNATDETVVRFSESASESFDSDWDAYKLQGGIDAPQLNSVAADNSRLSINSLPFSSSELSVPLDFALNASTDVTFITTGLETFEGEASAFLEDKLLNNMIDLRENPVYSFGHNPGNEVARFVLHFYGVNATGELDANAYQIWSVPSKLNIHIPALTGQKATIEIYDLLGHLAVAQQVTLSTPSTVNVPNFIGIAVVRVVSGDQVFTSKVFIR
ncbi:MAG: T9SS type A sorting domain-containing protein [Bacteroidales bacterium]